MKKRERIVLYTAALFVSLAVFDRLIFHPIIFKITSLNERIKEMESGIEKNLHVLAHKDRIMADSARYRSYLNSIASEEEKATSILKEIENLADKSAIYLVDMKPAGISEAGSSKRYSINLNCEAQMEQFMDFVYNIESSSSLLTVEKYQITPKSKDSSVVRCRVTISTIAVQ